MNNKIAIFSKSDNKVIDAIFAELRGQFIDIAIDKILDESGWRDTGGQG